MAGEARLRRDLGGLRITHFADHHDIRILAQYGAQSIAYARPVVVNGQKAVSIHAADGTPIGAAPTLARATAALDPAHLRVYRSSLSGRDRLGVIYGDFESREEAAQAMLALPESIKAIQPFPRQVSKLK